MEPIQCDVDLVHVTRFNANGSKIKEDFPWYPQDLAINSNSARTSSKSNISLDESVILKYAVEFPLRTSLKSSSKRNLDDSKYPDTVTFSSISSKNHDFVSSKQVEEIFVSKGVCLVSHGPLGGSCSLKALYRPIESCGTGVEIRSVTKVKFPPKSFNFSNLEDDNIDPFICLVEKRGVSMYSESSSETFVAQVPEFVISEVMACKYGLIFIPSKDKKNIDPTADFHKRIYILTHPIKQVSKIWFKARPGHNFSEYDNTDEELIACHNDLCIFWAQKACKLLIRRLTLLDKEEVVQISTLNATMYASNPHLSSRYAHQSHILNPSHSHSKAHFTRSAAMKANRESQAQAHSSSAGSYFPSIDFLSTTTGSTSLLHGFYPPHISIYDEPELYFKPIHTIDLGTRGAWPLPSKFKLVEEEGNIALWSLCKNNLYLHALNIESGAKLGNYMLPNTLDFVVSTDAKIPLLVRLSTNNEIHISWLDSYYNVICYSLLELSKTTIFNQVSSLENFLFGDSLICGLEIIGKNTGKNKNVVGASIIPSYAVLKIGSFENNYLIRLCMGVIKNKMPSGFYAHLYANVVGSVKKCSFEANDDGSCNRDKCDEPNWDEFTNAVVRTMLDEGKNDVDELLLKTMMIFKERFSLSLYYKNHEASLCSLIETIKLNMKNFDISRQLGIYPILPLFAYLLSQDSLLPHSSLTNLLPPILRTLLLDPDSIENMLSLHQLIYQNQNSNILSNPLPIISLLTSDVFMRNCGNFNFSTPQEVLNGGERKDYLSGMKREERRREMWVGQREECEMIRAEFREEPAWTLPVINMRIFSDDRRIEEGIRLVDSSSPLLLDVEPKGEDGDGEWVEEQERQLLSLVQTHFSAPVGRAALTLRTTTSSPSTLTSSIHLPNMSFSGKSKGKGSLVELSETDMPSTSTQWPHFHNAVAAALAVKFSKAPAPAWFAYNKTKISEGADQAGMILGYGLNGILASMPLTLRHEYLTKENTFMTMSMLLGLSANKIGTGDLSVWKLISLHIGAMLPACNTELDIPRFATLVAPLALGLLFFQSRNSHVAKVLLSEISKKFTPLSCFGPNNSNNSATITNPTDNSGVSMDREAHSLNAGLALGFVNLRKGDEKLVGFAADDYAGILRRFVVGGPKPTPLFAEQGEPQSQFDQMPSMWEEYRCCHIEEGENVNVDVATPSAIIATCLIYLRTGNEPVLSWLSPPSTLQLLDGVRPDLLMLRAIAYILVLKKLDAPDYNYLEGLLMSKPLLENSLKLPEENSKLNHESINVCWASIVCGICIGLGIRFAGTSDYYASCIIGHYTSTLLTISRGSGEGRSLAQYFPKMFLDSCLCNLFLSSSLILAGTGNVPVLKLGRYLQHKLTSSPGSGGSGTSVPKTDNNFYGLHMAISLGVGILFLGGGAYSLSNDDRSVGLLLATVYPKWPIHSNDNRYHLQALRHLYVLAAEPRLIMPKPMPHGSQIYFNVELNDGTLSKFPAPLLLPPFYLIKKISIDHNDYFYFEINLPEDLKYLKYIAENGGGVTLVHKPISQCSFGVIKEMDWRKENPFHETFNSKTHMSNYEKRKVALFNKVKEYAYWIGIKSSVTPILSLINSDTKSELWKWQVKVIEHWIIRSKARGHPSCFTDELIKILHSADSLETESSLKLDS